MKQELSQESLEQFPLRTDALPNGWSVAVLADFASDITPGFASGEHDSAGKGHPHMRPMNIDRTGSVDLSVVKSVPSTQNKTLCRGDILFNNTNSPDLVGKTAMIGESHEGYAFSNHMTRVRVEKNFSAGYFAHLLHFLWMSGYMKHRCTNHVNQASISSKTLAQTVPLLVPPSDEQTRIVEKLEELLSDLDAGVAELKAAQRKLAQFRQSLLKAAVEGALTSDWRAAHGNPQETGAELLQRILSERRTRWEQKQLAKFAEQGRAPPKGWQAKYPEPVAPDLTDVPESPEGWAWATWSQIGFSQNGRPFPSTDYRDEGVKLLRPGNLLVNGTVGWPAKNTRCLAEAYAEANADLIIGSEELVINLTAQSLKDDFLGRVCITGASERCLLNQRIARLTPVVVRTDFAHLVFMSPLFRRFVASLNTGSLIQHMFTSQMEAFVFPLPSLAEQERVVEAVGLGLRSIEDQSCAIEKALRQSVAQRKNLLKAAFAGQLVPQSPNDEPASALLARIRAERASNDGSAPSRRRKTA